MDSERRTWVIQVCRNCGIHETSFDTFAVGPSRCVPGFTHVFEAVEVAPVQSEGEREALLNVERAARELDAFFDPKNRGMDHEQRWVFDGRRVSLEASLALLSLHDYLNDVDRERSLAAQEAGTDG